MSDSITAIRYGTRATSANRFINREAALYDAIALMVTDALPQMLWSTLPNGYADYYNEQWYQYTGATRQTNDGDGWVDALHDDDREKCWDLWQHSLCTGEPFENEQRLRRHDGEYRWMLVRAAPVLGNAEAIIRWVGTCVDIHDLHLSQEKCDLLNRELDHRVANLFTIIGSLLSLEARHALSPDALAISMQARLASLNAAHRLIRSPVKKSDEQGASVHSVIRAIVKPYQNDDDTRFVVSGPDRIVDDGALTAIALLTHELCTNAVKYGALTIGSGEVGITTEVDGLLFKMDWTERGGPTLSEEEPVTNGFGTVLIRATVEQQLGGSIERSWTSEGISFQLTLPISALHHDLRTV